MAVVSYDLISINGTDIPDVKKGTVTVEPNRKFEALEGEEGNMIIEPISVDKIKGSVEYTGLFQSELQTIASAVELVSEMTIYNPRSGSTRTFLALITEHPSSKIIHDAGANAWTYGFDFEEIDYVEEEET